MAPQRTNIGTIMALAAATEGVVHARGLRAAGVDRSAVQRGIESGLLVELLPRTYGVGAPPTGAELRRACMAAVLHGGDGTHVDGVTALRLLEAWNRGEAGPVHVTSPRNSCLPVGSGVVVHRAAVDWRPTAPRLDGAIPLVGFVDACVRAAVVVTPWQLASIIQRGMYLGYADFDAIAAACAARAGAPGSRVLRAAIELVAAGSAGTRSATEDAVLADLLAAGVDVPLVNVRGALGLDRDEPDFVWPGRRSNLEIDGGHHDGPHQARDDELRDARARANGWRVLRLPARRYWRDRRRSIRRVIAFLDGEA